MREETDRVPLWCPVNEISYWAWAGGTVARFNPNARGRGAELKHQLVRASIAAIEAVWSVDPRARIVQIDPVINVVPRSSRPQSLRAAEAHRQAQFEAWDMLAGWSWPGLGAGPTISTSSASTTTRIINGSRAAGPSGWGIRGTALSARSWPRFTNATSGRSSSPRPVARAAIRVPWLRYVGEEVRAAIDGGIPVEGICLYPIVDYPGWANLRHCEVGLLGPLDERGHRAICLPLAMELRRQQKLFNEQLGSQPNAAVASAWSA